MYKRQIRYCIIQAASLKCDDSDALDGAAPLMFDTMALLDEAAEVLRAWLKEAR